MCKLLCATFPLSEFRRDFRRHAQSNLLKAIVRTEVQRFKTSVGFLQAAAQEPGVLAALPAPNGAACLSLDLAPAWAPAVAAVAEVAKDGAPEPGLGGVGVPVMEMGTDVWIQEQEKMEWLVGWLAGWLAGWLGGSVELGSGAHQPCGAAACG